MNDRALEVLLRQLAAAARTGAGGAAFLPAVMGAAPARLHAGLREALSGGGALSRALADGGVLDAGERALLEAGEHSGNIPEVLVALAETVAERRRARLKLVAGLLYPALLVVLAGFLLTAPIVVTRGVAAWLSVAMWPLAIVGSAALVFFVLLPRLPKDSALRTTPARVVESLPLLGPGLQRAGLGAFCQLLSQLVAAGVPYTLAVPAAMKAWPRFAPHEKEVLRAIAGGATLTDALRAPGVLPERILGPLHAGEHSGTVDDTLRALGREEVESGRRFTLGLALAMGGLAFLLVAAGIGYTIIAGATSYIERIDAITDDSP